MASVSIEMDSPQGVEVVSYERHQQGHYFEVTWPYPAASQCERCRHEEARKFETKDKAQVVGDLDVWGQPSFWCYPTAFHRCSRCNHRQHVLPPFKRKNVTYTYRHYFDARQTSAQVEGINNKARVITKRAYGLKSADSLWRRLILDVNEAKNLIGRSTDSIRELVMHFRVFFRPLCT